MKRYLKYMAAVWLLLAVFFPRAVFAKGSGEMVLTKLDAYNARFALRLSEGATENITALHLKLFVALEDGKMGTPAFTFADTIPSSVKSAELIPNDEGYLVDIVLSGTEDQNIFGGTDTADLGTLCVPRNAAGEGFYAEVGIASEGEEDSTPEVEYADAGGMMTMKVRITNGEPIILGDMSASDPNPGGSPLPTETPVPEPSPTPEPTVTPSEEVPIEPTKAPEQDPSPTPTLIPVATVTPEPTQGPSSGTAAPETVKLEKASVFSYKQIRITWHEVEGASGYRVYRKTSGSGWETLKTIGNASVLYYNDKNVEIGREYVYTVRAYRKADGKTVWGSYDQNGLKITAVLPAVKVVNARALDYGSARVAWEKLTGATGYRVFRKTPGGKWKSLKTLGASATSYTDSTADVGNTYLYTVRAYCKVDGKTVWGGYDNSGKTVKIVLEAVKLKSASSVSHNRIKVTWEKTAGADGYRIFRKTEGGRWKSLKTVSAAATSYTDTSAQTGTKYYYTVRAFRRVNGKAVWGSYDQNGKEAAASLAAVKLGSAVVSGKSAIKVTWNRVSGSDGYRVYRKVKGGKWISLKTVGSSVLSYTDQKAKPGVEYCYTVRAYCRLNGKNVYGSYDKAGVSAMISE